MMTMSGNNLRCIVIIAVMAFLLIQVAAQEDEGDSAVISLRPKAKKKQHSKANISKGDELQLLLQKQGGVYLPPYRSKTHDPTNAI